MRNLTQLPTHLQPGDRADLIGRGGRSHTGFSVPVTFVRWHEHVPGSRHEQREVTVRLPHGEPMICWLGDLYADPDPTREG